ncbi:MAG: 2-phosphosulfolactate phosphatase [Meiothermus sp.]|nr:2-phosphosulfolactate phosphatase [Meiothermus sp.]
MRVDLTPSPPYPQPALVVEVFHGSLVGLLLSHGAAEVWVSRSARAALLQAAEGGLLFGEQEGLPPEGFHYGTSLKHLESLEVGGRACVVLAPTLAKTLAGLPEGSLLAHFRNARAAVQRAVRAGLETVVAAAETPQPDLGNSVAAGFLARRLAQARGQGASEVPGLAPALLRSYPDPQEALFQSEWGQRLYRTSRTEEIALASVLSVEETVPVLQDRVVYEAAQHGLSKDRTVYCFRAEKP